MSDLNDLNGLGQRVAQALEHRTGDERMLAKVKARFHQAVGQKRVPERRVWFAFAGGALLVMLADTLMPEAFELGGREAGLLTALGFALGFALS